MAPEAEQSRAHQEGCIQLVYGRDATEEEIALGLEYLKTEPMLEYEERKKKSCQNRARVDPAWRRGGPGGPRPS